MSRRFPLRSWLLVLTVLAALALSSAAVRAQSEPEPPSEAPATPEQPSGTPPPAAAPTEEPPPATPGTTPATPPPPTAEVPGQAAPPAAAPPTPPPPPEIPSNLEKPCAMLRAGAIGEDPIGTRYLDLVESGAATPKDYNDFGVFLARRYYLQAAETFVETSVEQEPENIDFWLNLGTVRLRFGKLSSALVAYEKARKLDVNSAQAHYGIGVVHDYMRNYDESVDSYIRALALDPSLGDPRKNPQAANNDRLLVVKLLLYQASGGGLALPLQGGPADDPAKPKPPVIPTGNGKKS
jgi:hypothetical protein